MNIPDEAVEAAAQAIRETAKTWPRPRSLDGPAQLARAQARAALEAALNDLVEGARSGQSATGHVPSRKDVFNALISAGAELEFGQATTLAHAVMNLLEEQA